MDSDQLSGREAALEFLAWARADIESDCLDAAALSLGHALDAVDEIEGCDLIGSLRDRICAARDAVTALMNNFDPPYPLAARSDLSKRVHQLRLALFQYRREG